MILYRLIYANNIIGLIDQHLKSSVPKKPFASSILCIWYEPEADIDGGGSNIMMSPPNK